MTCVLRISGTTGLEPSEPRTPLAQQVLDAVSAVPGVAQVAIEPGDRDCAVIVHWVDGVDPLRAEQSAWGAVCGVLPDATFAGLSWELGKGEQ